MKHFNSPKDAALFFASKQLAEGYVFITLHHYKDTNGNDIYWRIRLKHPDPNYPRGDKWMRPMYRDEAGQYHLSEPPTLKDKSKPIYGQEFLAQYPNADIWCVEGEYCADLLNKFFKDNNVEHLNIAITSGGSSSAEKADWVVLSYRNVILWPDNDKPGEKYINDVAEVLNYLECTVRFIDISTLNLLEHGDVIDWLEINLYVTIDALLALPTIITVNNIPDHVNPMSGEEITYRWASDIQPKPINWLWHGRIARGKVSMIAGNPGLGKSQVTASIAAIVSTGGIFPGSNNQTEVGSVVFLSAEDDPEDTICPRLHAAGADLSRICIVDAVVSCNDDAEDNHRGPQRSFNLKNDLFLLEEMLNKIGNVAMIVIDPITAYLGNTDSHKNADIRALLSPLSTMAAKYNAAVVCVSHLNKSGTGEALMKVAGSLAFVAAARAAFVVTKDRDDETKRLFLPMKNNIGNDQTGFAFRVQSAQLDSPSGNIETSSIVWERDVVNISANEAMSPQGSGEERTALDDAKYFLMCLLTNQEVSVKKIKLEAEDANISWTTINRAKQALGIKPRKEGMYGGWIWSLPDTPPLTQELQSKALIQYEDAHIKNMDTFSTDEHLRAPSYQPTIMGVEI